MIRQQEAQSRTLLARKEPSPEAKPAPTGKSVTGSAQARRHAPKQKSQQATKVVSVERVPAAVVAPPLQVMPEVSPPPMPTPDPRVLGQDGDDEPDRL